MKGGLNPDLEQFLNARSPFILTFTVPRKPGKTRFACSEQLLLQQPSNGAVTKHDRMHTYTDCTGITIHIGIPFNPKVTRGRRRNGNL